MAAKKKATVKKVTTRKRPVAKKVASAPAKSAGGRHTKTSADKAYMVQVGQNLRRARESAELSKKALADLSGVSYYTIVNIERGQQSIMSEKLMQICNALRVSPNRLLTGSEDYRPGDADPLPDYFKEMSGGSKEHLLMRLSLAMATLDLNELDVIGRLVRNMVQRDASRMKQIKEMGHVFMHPEVKGQMEAMFSGLDGISEEALEEINARVEKERGH